MIEKIIISLLMELSSWLYSKGINRYQKYKLKNTNDKEIDKNFEEMMNQFLEASNGQPLTPEKRASLDSSIKRFIRGSDSH